MFIESITDYVQNALDINDRVYWLCKKENLELSRNHLMYTAQSVNHIFNRNKKKKIVHLCLLI